MAAHARLSASSAARFLTCSASVRLAELLPPEDDSEYSIEGTAAHELGEMCLMMEEDAYVHLGTHVVVESDGDLVPVEVTTGMVEAVQVYLDYVREMQGKAELMVEHRIENPEIGPDFGGTADAVLYNVTMTGNSITGGFVHVIDYKHGVGVFVDVVDNKQLWYYAFGVLKNLGVTRDDDVNVGLSIVQPRYFGDENIRESWVKASDIIAWGEDVLIPGMLAVDSEDTQLVSGDHCQFCPAKLICPLAKEAFETMTKFNPDDVPGYSNEELAAHYDKVALASKYMTALKREAEKRAMDCNPLPGTKLIYGRASRDWKEGAEGALLEKFGDDALTEPALKSPAEIEKLPGGKQLTGRWAHKKEGQPKLVASTERGREYDPSKQGSGFASIKTP